LLFGHSWNGDTGFRPGEEICTPSENDFLSETHSATEARKGTGSGLIPFAGSVFAQSAKLSGRVTDSSGSIMLNAQVKLYRSVK
jgi:hypothetical protein